jgi:hypothetical protein
LIARRRRARRHHPRGPHRADSSDGSLRQRVLAGLDVLLDVRVVLVEAAARGDLYRGLPVLAERRIGVVLDPCSRMQREFGEHGLPELLLLLLGQIGWLDLLQVLAACLLGLPELLGWDVLAPVGLVGAPFAMSRELDAPKAAPGSAARAIFDGVEQGDEEMFPDPKSETMAESWRGGAAKALEREYAALVEAEPVKS